MPEIRLAKTRAAYQASCKHNWDLDALFRLTCTRCGELFPHVEIGAPVYYHTSALQGQRFQFSELSDGMTWDLKV